jgi:DNA-binding GntR family transcriptional regulator
MSRTRKPSPAKGGRTKQATLVKEPGYGRVAQLLREEIVEGRIPPGARIKVSEIASRFGTSTNPAREALQMLEGEGLLTITPNRGASVREITEDLVRNVFDIRLLLEPYIVRGFVEYARPEDLALLKGYQEKCQEGVDSGDYALFHSNNVLFHSYMTDHHFNKEAIAIIRKHGSWVRALSSMYPLPVARMRQSVAEHWAFLEAAERGDSDEAVRVMEAHLAHSQAVFLEGMRRERARRVA